MCSQKTDTGIYVSILRMGLKEELECSQRQETMMLSPTAKLARDTEE